MSRGAREIMTDLAGTGLTPEQLALVVELTAAVASNAESGPSKAAQRTRAWRERKASQTVTRDAAVTLENQDDETSQNVTERHGDVTRDNAPLNRESKREVAQSTKRHRGERLPSDWMPVKADLEFASSKGLPRPRIENEVERFRNYWVSKPGKAAIKLDWSATWRNWILQSLERAPVRGGGTDEQDWRKAII